MEGGEALNNLLFNIRGRGSECLSWAAEPYTRTHSFKGDGSDPGAGKRDHTLLRCMSPIVVKAAVGNQLPEPESSTARLLVVSLQKDSTSVFIARGARCLACLLGRTRGGVMHSDYLGLIR